MSAFIFDIDGTLIDSVAMYLKGLQDTMRRYDRDYTLEELTFSNGIPSQDTAKHLGFSGDAATEMINQWIADSKVYAPAVDWIAGMPETLSALRDAGHKIGIVTSKAAPEFAIDDQRYHFSDYIDTAVLAHDAKRNKPFGDPILLALDRLGETTANAVYIGDTVTDSHAAKDAQVPFALATWTNQPSDELQPIAYALKTPSDLLTL
ncbi:HAD family hydrolase [Lacticaseibacillus porcinae]|uniref:HAD family hydrolase n=1 Tax=Lacticaseibacillus porcinae TaxID=1123687 RepID=UPI000F794559|nr:HAD-IA family hydrolase [Lacticaseibacillus porcinae]